MPAAARLARLGQTVVSALLVFCALSLLPACSADNRQDALHALLEKERLVEQTRLNLLLAVAAEKNAVLSSTEDAATPFIVQARKSMTTARDDLARLTELVNRGDDVKEIAALLPVTADFIELTAVDSEIQRLVGRNTNLRAAVVSRTEAAQALERFQQALAPFADGPDCPAAREALRAVAAGAAILALHAPHIEENTEAGMDALEVKIAAQNNRATVALGKLAESSPATEQTALEAAKAAYADFWRATQEILTLSRENTNVHTLALVMGRKRLVAAKALDDLTALAAVVEAKEFKATR